MNTSLLIRQVVAQAETGSPKLRAGFTADLTQLAHFFHDLHPDGPIYKQFGAATSPQEASLKPPAFDAPFGTRLHQLFAERQRANPTERGQTDSLSGEASDHVARDYNPQRVDHPSQLLEEVIPVKALLFSGLDFFLRGLVLNSDGYDFRYGAGLQRDSLCGEEYFVHQLICGRLLYSKDGQTQSAFVLRGFFERGQFRDKHIPSFQDKISIQFKNPDADTTTDESEFVPKGIFHSQWQEGDPEEALEKNLVEVDENGEWIDFPLHLKHLHSIWFSTYQNLWQDVQDSI